jgi:hypothetical protein
MRRFLKGNGLKGCWVFITIVLCGCLFGVTPVWGYESSGLSLRLFTDQRHPDLKYMRGEEQISILIVMTNEAGVPLATKRGFSELELHRTLTVTDPFGARHLVGDGQDAHKMPIPYFLNGKPWGLAEELPQNWVRSAQIDDLTELVPIMKTTPGWYTVKGLQFFARYASTSLDPDLGLIGLLVHPNNWTGAVESNTLQIYVAPMSGGQIRVQVVDETPDPDKPLAQVPVKVFKKTDIPSGSTLDIAWESVSPVLTGTTDFDGYATWESSSACLVDDDYTVLAKFSGEIKSESVTSSETGWADGCTGSIQKTIFFGTLPPQEIHITGAGFNFPETPKYRAVFSVSAISKDSNVSGKIVYNYTRTRMIFNSEKIIEVSVTGTSGKIKGEGTVNQAKGFTFEVIVVDGSPDQFGITIWKPDGAIYYQAATSALSGGELGIKVK